MTLSSVTGTSYRPFIQLNCEMTHWLVDKQRFSKCPFIVGDVGARSGFDSFWDIFKDQCMQIGFEPDQEESARLKQKYDAGTFRIENVALWENVGVIDFFVNKDPNTSSCYHPNLAFFNRFPDSSSVETISTVNVKTTTLDNYSQLNKTDFDVLKIDVQGGELPILKGSTKQLETSVLAVIAEVEFVELYKGQALFSDLEQYMRAQGFALFDLDIRRWRRKPLSKEFDGIRVGQTIYADALFLWDPISSFDSSSGSSIKTEKLIKLATLAELFSVPDYSIEIVMFADKLNLIDSPFASHLITLLNSNRIIAHNNRNISR